MNNHGTTRLLICYAIKLPLCAPTVRVSLEKYGGFGFFLTSYQSVTAFFAGNLKVSKLVDYPSIKLSHPH